MNYKKSFNDIITCIENATIVGYALKSITIRIDESKRESTLVFNEPDQREIFVYTNEPF